MFNKALFIALGTAVVFSFGSTASAQHCHNGNYGNFGNQYNYGTPVHNHGNHQVYYGGHGQGQFGNSSDWHTSNVPTWQAAWHHQPSRPVWHDQTHFDYHPGQFVRHQNHHDYRPGHVDRHRQGHWHR